jgi:hypothetical protein
MNAELKAKWVEALRSGNYSQGHGLLKRREDDNTAKHCCLGVLCELIDPTKFTPRTNESRTYEYGLHGFSSDITLPPSVQCMTGLDEETCQTLANMNDTGNTFQDIAAYIQQQL